MGEPCWHYINGFLPFRPTKLMTGCLFVIKYKKHNESWLFLGLADRRIRHIPVIDDTGMLGMVSIGDVVRAVVTEHQQELNRLSAFIQGSY